MPAGPHPARHRRDLPAKLFQLVNAAMLALITNECHRQHAHLPAIYSNVCSIQRVNTRPPTASSHRTCLQPLTNATICRCDRWCTLRWLRTARTTRRDPARDRRTCGRQPPPQAASEATMTKRSRNGTAVVTGAGSGIGAAFAVELAHRGNRVVCADIDDDAAACTVKTIHRNGGTATAIHCDVSRLDHVNSLAAQAQSWFGGPPTLVINNAGVGAGGRPIGETPIDDW